MLNEAGGNNPSREQSVEAQVIEIMRSSLEQTDQVADIREYALESLQGQFNNYLDSYIASHPDATDVRPKLDHDRELQRAWITETRQGWVISRKQHNKDSEEEDLAPEATAFNKLVDKYVAANPEATDIYLSPDDSAEDKATYMQWGRWVINKRITERRLLAEYITATQDNENQVHELIEGKSVVVKQNNGADHSNVFSSNHGPEVAGRVVGASALLGTLTVRTALKQDVTAYIFSNDDKPAQQAEIKVTD